MAEMATKTKGMTTEIKERPILFKGEMVRAIMSDSKRQTRRIVKPQPIEVDDGLEWDYPGCSLTNGKIVFHGSGTPKEWNDSPFGKIGDRLWVRETFHKYIASDERVIYSYRADNHLIHGAKIWKPSLFMPRVACRNILEITVLRMERLNDITEEQAILEGVSFDKESGYYFVGDEIMAGDAVSAFRMLWESINGDGSWALNPFVWVIEFKRVQ